MAYNQEEWKPVVGFEGIYDVSSFGRVRRINPTKRLGPDGILKQTIAGRGRLYVGLSRPGGPLLCMVHKLVTEAFFGLKLPGYQVNHIDGNPQNNHVTNLEYVTILENLEHATRLGLRAWGERNAKSKLTNDQVKEIRLMLPTKSNREIALLYGVVPSTIYKIRIGQNYSRVV